MTDNEIIKAIQFCKGNNTIVGCRKCPYVECDTDDGCLGELFTDVLNLINRQKETIEQLNTALFKCGEDAAEIANYKKIAENQQSLSMERGFEIKRLKEEIERLHKECDEAWEQHSEALVKYDLLFDEATALIENAKSDAVKEFAETIKANQRKLFNYIYSRDGFAEIIDNLVKEFTEGKDD